MKDKKVLTIQDFSSVGECSCAAAIAIISAMGIETVALPIAVLSAQTSSFDDYTYVDLQDNLIPSARHLKNNGLDFDFIFTGYLGKSRAVKDVIKLRGEFKKAFLVVDPAMAEHGALYDGITEDFVGEVAKLCRLSDFALPNVSEACLIAGTEYKEILAEQDIEGLAAKLTALGIKNFAITGIKTEKGMKAALCENGKTTLFNIDEVAGQFFGSGDVFSATFVGGLACGIDTRRALKLAIDFTQKAIEFTAADQTHFYGLKFEKAIPFLVERTTSFSKSRVASPLNL